MCTALINLGNVYRSCALYEECERALSEALSLAEELGVAHLRAGAALSLGNLKLTTGELCEAERQYRSALERYRHLGDRVREGAVLFNLAQVFSQQKKEAEACRFYAEALRVARITEHRRGEMRALTEYARCKVALGQTAEGRRMAQEALPIARELDNRNGLLRNLVTIAFSDQAAGADTQEVLKEIEEAGRTLEGVHGEVKYLREIIQPSPVDGSFLLVPDRIAQKAERLFQIGHSEGRPEECAFACAVKAIVSARKGEKEKAKQYARDACSHLRDTGTMPPAGSAFGEVLALAARETGEEIAPG